MRNFSVKEKLLHRFFTESLDLWHEAGLLTCLSNAAFPFFRQWQRCITRDSYHQKLTAAGTVLDFHKIPF
jgi:hypothetical protein